MAIKEKILDTSAEQRIILAAENVFMREGFDGARMQAIADEANINKAMLHYYFRSKEMLFDKIFEQKIDKFFPKVLENIIDQNITFLVKVDFFIDNYINLCIEYPYLPLFILNEVNKKNVDNKLLSKKIPQMIIKNLGESYYKEVAKGKLRKIDFMQFYFSLMGMIIFPFLAKPIITKITSQSEKMFLAMMQDRSKVVKDYVRLILAKH